MITELSILIPTRNERPNVKPLITALDKALEGVKWEAIFVDDDSDDGTQDLIRKIANQDPRIRCLHRIGRRGLSSACIEGMLASAAPFLAVMDADMQHDEKLLYRMLRTLKERNLDIVVGSRYVEGGSTGSLQQPRVKISKLATYVSQLVLKVKLSDPLSGYFMLTRSFFERTVRRLSGKGFKILLDLFASAETQVRFLELPYTMRERAVGESKLDLLVAWEFSLLLYEKLFGRLIPVRFLMFVTVGCFGALIHLLLLGLMTKLLGTSFVVGQSGATVIAIGTNFIGNNLFTYHDQRLKGRSFLWGLLTFYLACSIGAFINIRIACFIYSLSTPWWLSGLIGAMIGAIWNYAITSTFTWKMENRSL